MCTRFSLSSSLRAFIVQVGSDRWARHNRYEHLKVVAWGEPAPPDRPSCFILFRKLGLFFTPSQVSRGIVRSCCEST